MSVLIKGLEMPETEYMDVRIFRDGTVTLETGTKPYYRELKAEPVRHGKWIHKGGGIFICGKCSCHIGLNVYTEEKASERFRWCPHCGARMDEE